MVSCVLLLSPLGDEERTGAYVEVLEDASDL